MAEIPSGERPRRRLGWALVLSLGLHIALWLLAWQEPEATGPLRPVRFAQEQAPRRFAMSRPLSQPAPVMERLAGEAESVVVEEDAAALPEAGREVAALPLELGDDPSLPSGKSLEIAPAGTLSLNELALDGLERRIAELATYERLWLPDADTTDIESRRRRQGEAVVLRALEAMGGARALAGLQSMRSTAGLHKRYGTTGKYASGVGGVRFVYDGERGWIEIYGRRHALKDLAGRTVQRRAERWDFLSRYLGEGVQVKYVGREAVEGGYREVVAVEDFKYGLLFKAYFDAQTHLPVGEDIPLPSQTLARPVLQVRYRDYRAVGDVKVWYGVEETRSGVEYRSLDQSAYFDHTRRYAVSYDRIDDVVFAPARPAAPDMGLETFESAATLWVDVEVSNAELVAVAALPGGTPELNGLQRTMARRQVAEYLVEDLRRRGLVPKVEVLDDAWNRLDLPVGDFVLEVKLDSYEGVISYEGVMYYQALLYEAATRTLLMQDGPPNKLYALLKKRECGVYRLRPHTVGGDIAYLHQEGWGGFAERVMQTYRKLEPTIKRYEYAPAKGDEGMPYLRDCCYCQGE